jgi:hypothetical protein
MMEGAQRRTGEAEEQIKEREAEATSKKTLREVEKSEKSSQAGDHDSVLPSPDGAFDEGSELEDADPI